MNTEKIISADEFIDTQIPDNIKREGYSFGDIGRHTVKIAMIEFAKLHVKAALKKVNEKATVTPIDFKKISEGSFRPIWGVDDDSILNVYPLENIK